MFEGDARRQSQGEGGARKQKSPFSLGLSTPVTSNIKKENHATLTDAGASRRAVAPGALRYSSRASLKSSSDSSSLFPSLSRVARLLLRVTMAFPVIPLAAARVSLRSFSPLLNLLQSRQRGAKVADHLQRGLVSGPINTRDAWRTSFSRGSASSYLPCMHRMTPRVWVAARVSLWFAPWVFLRPRILARRWGSGSLSGWPM